MGGEVPGGPPPPGWYADPDGGGTRYWDGSGWTEHRSAQYTAPTMPPPDPRSRAANPTPPASAGTGARPTRGDWWPSNWKWVATGVGGLIVGVALGATDQTSSTKTDTETVAKVRTRTETVRSVKTVRERPPARRSAAPSTGGGGGGGVQSYSGNGGKNLGTIEVPSDSTLEWTNDGDIFQIFTSDGVPVNSQAHHGTTELTAGTHSDFQVNAIGDWTIKIRPH